jgi:hypothetical protein
VGVVDGNVLKIVTHARGGDFTLSFFGPTRIAGQSALTFLEAEIAVESRAPPKPDRMVIMSRGKPQKPGQFRSNNLWERRRSLMRKQ